MAVGANSDPALDRNDPPNLVTPTHVPRGRGGADCVFCLIVSGLLFSSCSRFFPPHGDTQKGVRICAALGRSKRAAGGY